MLPHNWKSDFRSFLKSHPTLLHQQNNVEKYWTGNFEIYHFKRTCCLCGQRLVFNTPLMNSCCPPQFFCWMQHDTISPCSYHGPCNSKYVLMNSNSRGCFTWVINVISSCQDGKAPILYHGLLEHTVLSSATSHKDFGHSRHHLHTLKTLT